MTSSKDAFALAVLVGILSCDFSLAGGIGQWEHQGLLHMLAHLLYHFLHKSNTAYQATLALLVVQTDAGRRGSDNDVGNKQTLQASCKSMSSVA